MPSPPINYKPYHHHYHQHHQQQHQPQHQADQHTLKAIPPKAASNTNPANDMLQQFQKSRQDILQQVTGMVQEVKKSVGEMTSKSQALLNLIQKLQQQQIVLQKQQLLLQQEQRNLIKQQHAKKANGVEVERRMHRNSESDTHQEIEPPINLPWSGRLRILKIVDDDSTFFLEVACAAYALSVDANILKREVVSWPAKLIAELIPKTFIEKIDATFFKNSKRVFFDQLKTTEKNSTPMSMLHDYVGYIYFPSASANSVKVIVLKFTADNPTFRGFIPNDQQAFLLQLTKIIQEERVHSPLVQRNVRTKAAGISDSNNAPAGEKMQQSMIISRGSANNQIVSSHHKQFVGLVQSSQPNSPSFGGSAKFGQNVVQSNSLPRQYSGSPMRKHSQANPEATNFPFDEKRIQGPINVLDDQIIQGVVPNTNFVKLLAAAVVQELQASTPPTSPQHKFGVQSNDYPEQHLPQKQQQSQQNPSNYQATSTMEEFIAQNSRIMQNSGLQCGSASVSKKDQSVLDTTSESYRCDPQSNQIHQNFNSNDDLTQQTEEIFKMQQLIRNILLQGQSSSLESQAAQNIVFKSGLSQHPLVPNVVRDSYNQCQLSTDKQSQPSMQTSQMNQNIVSIPDLPKRTAEQSQSIAQSVFNRTCDKKTQEQVTAQNCRIKQSNASIINLSDVKSVNDQAIARDDDVASGMMQQSKESAQAEDYTILSNKLQDYINDLRQQRADVFQELFNTLKLNERSQDLQMIQQKLQPKEASVAQELQDNQEIINNFNRKVDMLLDHDETQDLLPGISSIRQQHKDEKFQTHEVPDNDQQQQQQSVEDDERSDKSKKCVHIEEANNRYYIDEFELL